jgi:uncharacterized lipoprotein YehR (DUF1307 family)
MQKIKHILVILVLILPLALSIIACDDDEDGQVSIGREACIAACSTQYERGSDNWASCTSLCPAD